MANRFFHSISANEKRFTMNEVVKRIKNFINADPEREYKIYIGSDSHCIKSVTIYVTAIVIHRVGKGAIYFYCKWHESGRQAFVNRLYNEAYGSIVTMNNLLDEAEEIVFEYPCFLADNITIHVDAGTRGKTQNILPSILGLVRGNGFNCECKPNSFSATYVADRHSKS